VLRETEQPADDDESNRPGHRASASNSGQLAGTGSSSSSRPVTLAPTGNLTSTKKSKDKDKKSKNKNKNLAFNLDKEKPQLLEALAASSVASTNLLNALKLVDRSDMRVSEDPEVLTRFETCKTLRRQILRYIQFVESEQWLGSLIHANDELVNALMAFEVLDKSVEEDSDSEDEQAAAAYANRRRSAASSPTSPNVAASQLQGLNLDANKSRGMSIPVPPRMGPGKAPEQKDSDTESESESEEEEEDENDPFADRNAVVTPAIEPKGLKW
jgi:hypothetical protein